LSQQLRQRRAGLGHERARHGRLRRRPRLGLQLLPDRLIDPRRAARGDAGEHPLQHHLAEQIARGELLVAGQLDLLAVGRGPHPRPADLDAASAERHLARRVTVPLRGPLAVVAALRANDPLDLPLHRLVQHRQAGADCERQQSLLRLPGDLAQRQLDVLRQRQRHRLLTLDDLDNV
jgi:hypothetical protein